MNIIFVSIIILLFSLYIFWIAAFVFLQRREPASIIAWLLIFIALPIIGFVLYFFFGRDLSKKKVFFIYDFEKKNIKKAIKQRNKNNKLSLKYIKEISEEKDVMKLIENLSGFPISFNNKVKYYTDGIKKFNSLKQDILEAKNEINILYFIYKKGILGNEIKKLLIKKAQEGIKVRLLLDDLGSRKVRNYFNDLINAGGKVSFSFPVAPFYIKINNRNHRKIVIIDRKVAYLGGYNIGDEYIGLKKRMGYWRDTHIKIKGTCVSNLLMRFILDWRHSGNNDMFITQDLFKFHKPLNTNVGVQVLSSGPNNKLDEIKLAYMEMISSAKKYIYIQSPYFVPDSTFLEVLKIALLKGVKIKFMIPNKQDHIFVYWATYSFIGDLLPLGLKAYMYNNGFLHAKTILVDGKVGSIGSSNFDARSFNLSFETNVFLYGIKTGNYLKQIFEKDLKKCIPLTLEMYNKRSLRIRLKEPISRLISPLL